MKIGLITARGGSKGLPRKNIKPLLGLPLIGWTIHAALKSKYLDAVYVSSEDPEILKVSASLGAKVIVRPEYLAQDNSSSEEVISHAIKVISEFGVDISTIVLLQPTSPLRNSVHIDECLNSFSECNADCMISVYEPKHTPIKAYLKNQNGELKGLYSDDAPYEPRQSLPTAYLPNGAIYVFSKNAFLINNKIPKSHVYPFVMEESESVDIDDLSDFEHAENILRLKNES